MTNICLEITNNLSMRNTLIQLSFQNMLQNMFIYLNNFRIRAFRVSSNIKNQEIYLNIIKWKFIYLR